MVKLIRVSVNKGSPVFGCSQGCILGNAYYCIMPYHGIEIMKAGSKMQQRLPNCQLRNTGLTLFTFNHRGIKNMWRVFVLVEFQPCNRSEVGKTEQWK